MAKETENFTPDPLADEIMALLSKVDAQTGGTALLFIRLPGQAGFSIFGHTEDPDGFVAELYDTAFPSLIDEVKAIERMGTALLRHNYNSKYLHNLLEECNELEDAQLREQLTNVLLDAKMKLGAPKTKRRRQ